MHILHNKPLKPHAATQNESVINGCCTESESENVAGNGDLKSDIQQEIENTDLKSEIQKVTENTDLNRETSSYHDIDQSKTNSETIESIDVPGGATVSELKEDPPDLENGLSESNGDLRGDNSNLPDIIKMTYDLTLPHKPCDSLGEALLRGFLKEYDYDCILQVSGTQFKAHKYVKYILRCIFNIFNWGIFICS